MAQAKQGDTVRVHYTGSLQNGSQFDSSVGRSPLEFKLGAGNVIAGFEQALMGMNEGEGKTVTILAEQAYGPRLEEAVKDVPRSAIPAHIELQEGIQLQANDASGQTMVLTVVSFSEETVSLDANHPLAGEDLTFDLELVEII